MEKYKYTPNYCEENIWQLCKHPALQLMERYVLIISNKAKNCPIYHQKSGKDGEPVWWDYHVVLLAKDGRESWIYDFDSTLEFPVKTYDYLKLGFPAEKVNVEDLPLFKVIPSKTFVKEFHSDRSHMVADDGSWIFQPPKWPRILSETRMDIKDLKDFANSRQEICTLYEMFLT